MKIGISQPTFIPWYGYFGLIDYVDEFILLNDVQFEPRSWQQRNFIKFNNEKLFLTVPVLRKKKKDQKIYEVKINKEDNYIKKFIKTIEQSYKKSSYYSSYSKDIFDIISNNNENLMDLNINFIKYFCNILNINTKITNSFDLELKSKKEDLIKEICKIKKCDEYISTIGAKDYLGDKLFFNQTSIKIKYFSINDFFYNQIGDKYLEKLSILDIVFNEGPNALNIIKKNFLVS
jgi:hypothetical protein